jgi:hypothetical protein
MYLSHIKQDLNPFPAASTALSNKLFIFYLRASSSLLFDAFQLQ